MVYQPELIGGHLVIDLVNTVSWRLDPARRIDRLETPADLADWCAAVGLSPGSARLETVGEVRDTAYRVLVPLARGEAQLQADLEAMRRLVVDALAVAKAPSRGQARLLDWEVSELVPALGLSAARLLEREDLSRLRECQDDSCGWLFLDKSKNGSRRWCSSADCGNRARAKRHYQRVRES